VRFALGAYDPTRPLVIDPAIVYATYLGSVQDEKIVAIETNAAREVYVFGSTADPGTFPATASAGLQPGGANCFLSKFSADGSQLLYSVLIIDTAQVQGITSPVFCDAMTLGPNGTVDIVHQSSVNGTFVKTLKTFVENPAQPGMITYSELRLTPLEGFLPVSSVKVDSAGNVYVLGGCYNFRAQNPGPSLPNGFRTTPNSGNCRSLDNFFSIGPSESVLVKYDASGNLVYGTLIGGSLDHETAARSLAIDNNGIAYVAGGTVSTDFPATANAFQQSSNTSAGITNDAFFMKVDTNQAGSASLAYSSFLGGSGQDAATEIGLDKTGIIYVAGSTQSGDFPQFPQPLGITQNYGQFLAQFDITQAGAAQELYGITFGGNQPGTVTGLAILPFSAGVAISGLTRDTNFSLVAPLYTQAVFGPCSVGVGNACPFVSVFLPPTASPAFSTFLDDTGEAFDVRISGDSLGNLYALLQTTEFGRGTRGAYQPQNAGMTDALVLKIGGVAVPPPNHPPVLDTLLPIVRAATSSAGAAVFVSANWTDPDGDPVTATFVGPLDSAVGSQSVVGFTAATLNFPIGTSTFTVTVDDGRGGIASGSTQVTVLGSVVSTSGTVDMTPSPTFNSFDKLIPAFEPSTRLRIENVSQPVLVTLNIRSNVGNPPLPSGYQLGSPPYYYDFASTPSVGGPYTVCIDTAGMSFASSNLRMFFYDGTSWTDSTLAGFGTPTEVCGQTSTLGTYAILHTIVPSNNAVTVAGSGFSPGQIDGPGGDPRDDFVDGGQATASGLSAGGGLAFDRANGLLYVGSLTQIRRVNLATGIMDTIAGDGAVGQFTLDPADGAVGILTPEGVDAQTVHLTNPHQLALDLQGNLYVAEYCRVRKIDRLTNIITTVAGDGFCRFRGDGGLATSANLNGSFGLVIDSAGNLLVGGLAGIRAVDALSGIIRTVVSVSLAPPAGVSRMALAPSGDLYFVSSADGLLFRVSPGADGLINGSSDESISLVNSCAQPACPVLKFGGDGGPLTSATFKLPQTIAVDSNGDLLIGDPFDYRIRRVSASDGSISTVVGYNPSTILQSGAGFSSQAEDHGLSAGAFGVSDIVIDPRGGFFFASEGVNEVRRIGADPNSLNQPPIANAGPDQNVPSPSAAGTGLTLDGSASSDPDPGDTLTYKWTEGSNLVGTSPIVNTLAILGVHTYTLTVTDRAGATSTDTVVVTITLGADLSITASSSPNPVDTDQTLTYSGTVSNQGPADATNGQLIMPISVDQEFLDSSFAPGACRGPATGVKGTVKCDLGNLAKGASLPFSIRIKPTKAGPLRHTLSVLADQGDPNTADNSIAVDTTVNLGPKVIDVKETITITDRPALLPSAMIPVTENITVTDTPGVLPSAMIPVTESIKVSDAVDLPDVTAPKVTPPADISIGATEADGARGNIFTSANSRKLHDFLLGGTATDDRDTSPVRQTPQMTVNNAVVDATDDRLFPIGQSTPVTFRFKDAAGNIGTATANVLVTVAIGGTVGTDGIPVNPTDSNNTPQPIQATFAGVTQSGLVTADVMLSAPPFPTGFTAVSPVYDIATTALYTGPVDVRFVGTNFTALDRLYHFQSDIWVDVTTAASPTNVRGSVNTLSPFVVLRPANHAPSAIASGPASVEAASPAGASVTLTGLGTDPDTGDTLSFAWSEGATTLGTAASITVTLPVGSHNLTFTVTDNHGASSTASVSVAVQDTKPPVLVLPGNQIVEGTSPAGAAATFAASASDVVDGARPVTCAPVSGSTFPLGTTVVNCTAADTRLNSASGSFGITVRDKTPPTIGVTTPASGAVYARNQAVAASYACADNVSAVTSCVGPVRSGANLDTATTGTKTFTVNASDAAGNTSSRSVTYQVLCHYVTISSSPSSVAQGGTVTVTGRLMSCASTSQTVVIQFTLTGPSPRGACSSTSSVMFTTPPITLPPNTLRTVSFPFRVPTGTCAGTYTITATTKVNGNTVDVSSSTLTVTSH
jgi:uncharacterized protein DUF11/K319-like protein/HYR domain-containing protein/Big-like domain-containing protein